MRAVRFYAVGATGIAVQLAALWLLHDTAGLGLMLATVIAVELAVLNNFAWHERWTWSDRPGTPRVRLVRLARFHLTNGVISILGNVAVTKLLHDGLGVHYLVASAASIAMCSVANYWASELLVFGTLSEKQGRNTTLESGKAVLNWLFPRSREVSFVEAKEEHTGP